MLKKMNKKGFTLAELLIVVAIIGVLVAISIPIFTTQLEKSREAVDLANIRAAYAECTADVLTDSKNGYYKKVNPKQTKAGWVVDVSDVAGKDLSSVKPVSGTPIFVQVTKDGEFSVVTSKPVTGFIDADTVGNSTDDNG